MDLEIIEEQMKITHDAKNRKKIKQRKDVMRNLFWHFKSI